MWNRGAALFAIILATLATQIMIERITILTLGDQPRTFDEFTLGGPLKIGPIAVSYQLFWILGCGALMVRAAVAVLHAHDRPAGRCAPARRTARRRRCSASRSAAC